MFKPLYYDQEFKRFERKLDKFEAKSGWYQNGDKAKSNWWARLPKEWRGSKPVQIKVPGMSYMSILQVQSSRDCRLLREFAKVEPRLAKSTGYHVKLVERSGNPPFEAI